MKSSIRKELPLIFIVVLPFLYLISIWNSLPEKIPLHWNMEGEIDRYGEKYEIILVPILLPLMTYILFTIIPKIDPKKRIKQMGKKYHMLKTVVTILTSIIAIVVIYAALNEKLFNPNYMVLIIGILFVFLGNYFKTLRPNYFIGIKTPWTLENEKVWNKTHLLAGKLWFVGGAIIVLSSLLLENKPNFTLFICITVIISVVPIVYSYFKYKELATE